EDMPARTLLPRKPRRNTSGPSRPSASSLSGLSRPGWGLGARSLVTPCFAEMVSGGRSHDDFSVGAKTTDELVPGRIQAGHRTDGLVASRIFLCRFLLAHRCRAGNGPARKVGHPS